MSSGLLERFRVAFASIVLGATSWAHADLLVGDSVAYGSASPVLRFANDADGASLPFGAFYTNAGAGGDVLFAADSLTWEPGENVFYAADFVGQAIRVYPANASGNTPALRKFNAPQLGQPRQIAISTEHDEMIVVNSSGFVTVYPRLASGTSVPILRQITLAYFSGSVTRLNNPGGVVLRTSSDEIAVPDYGVDADNNLFGVILFFARTANGNVAPVRTIEGPDTMLGIDALQVAYDAGHDELYVASSDTQNYPYDQRISVFAGNASGNAAPLRSIAGSHTLLTDIHSLAYDSVSETLFVSEGGENGVAPAVLAFARTDFDGDVAPERTLTPNNGSFTSPHGIAVVPADSVFANGFQ